MTVSALPRSHTRARLRTRRLRGRETSTLTDDDGLDRVIVAFFFLSLPLLSRSGRLMTTPKKKRALDVDTGCRPVDTGSPKEKKKKKKKKKKYARTNARTQLVCTGTPVSLSLLYTLALWTPSR